MTQVSKHIIKTQAYHLDLQDRNEAHYYQNAISGLQANRLSALINRVLDQFDHEKAIYKFNSIELDLGRISPSNYENEIAYKLEEELTQFLKQSITDNGSVIKGTRLSLNDGMLEDLGHFLNYGHYPWNTHHSWSSIKLFEALAESDSVGLVAMLRKAGLSAIVRKRMIIHFDDQTLDTVVRLVTPRDQEHIIEHKNRVLEYQEQERFINTGFSVFKNAVWEIILGYVFASGKGYFDKRSFLKYLIQKVGEKFNIDYLALLEIILRVVEQEGTVLDHQDEFKQMILELGAVERQRKSLTNLSRPFEPKEEQSLLDQLFKAIDAELFNPQFPFRSKREFNTALNKALLTSPTRLMSRLDRWLSQPSRRLALLKLSDTTVLNQIVDKSSHFNFKVTRALLNDLDKQAKQLSANAKSLFQGMSERRGSIIMSLPIHPGDTESSILHKTLLGLLDAASGKEDQFIDAIRQSQPQLAPKHREAVAAFVADLYPNIGRGLLDNIARATLSQFRQQPPELWGMWFNDNLKSWKTDTGLSGIALIDYVESYLDSYNIGPTARQFFKLLRQQSDDELSVAWDFQYKTSTPGPLDPLRKNMVLYVLEHGRLPWWCDQTYTRERFNTDFFALWTDGRMRKTMRGILQEGVHNRSYTRLLNTSNLNRVLEELDGSEGAASTLLKQWLTVLRQDLIPLQRINESQFQDYQEAVLRIVNTAKPKDVFRDVLAYLRNWIEASGLLEEQTQVDRLIRLIGHLTSITNTPADIRELKSWYRELQERHHFEAKIPQKTKTVNEVDQDEMDVAAGPKPGSPNKLVLIHALESLLVRQELLGPKSEFRDLLYNLKEASKEKRSAKQQKLLLQLFKGLIITKPELFDRLLRQEHNRKALGEWLDDASMNELIRHRFNPQQKLHFDQSMRYFGFVKSYLSDKEYKTVRHKFMSLLLLEFSFSDTRTWSVEDWTRLVHRVLLHNLGTGKLHTIQKSLLAKPEAARKIKSLDMQQFMDTFNQHVSDSRAMDRIQSLEQPEDKPYRKLGEELPRDFSEAVFVGNAGLVILAPFLGSLFENTGLMEGSKFKDDAAIGKAYQLLEYAANGEDSVLEQESPLIKILCGLNMMDLVYSPGVLSAEDKATVNSLLEAVTQHWPALNQTSVEGLRESFLLRDAKLIEEEDSYLMQVEKKSFDMLMDQIPWSINMIKLSWMPKMLHVEWR